MNLALQPVALITGASSGMGNDFALRLIAEGYAVYGVARRVEQMNEIAAAGGKVIAIDVTDDSSMVNAVKRIIREQGRIDVLINKRVCMKKSAAVVIGVGPEKGLGAALCRQFAHEAYLVFAARRTAEKVEAVATAITASGGTAVAVQEKGAEGMLDIERLRKCIGSFIFSHGLRGLKS
ncbi:SDR family NAD(P)-dependent oxidoreductase [Pseudomonas gingeri]|uniref:SDR family NAD(P)-dependent oxidoreductase n=1 Tax=Pseudomonas gingeri TaxID=117681 RepID=UPI001C433E63|nr:SDR family NAD(P)-dependent oxidoreductase [Pseudomonas gingeri]